MEGLTLENAQLHRERLEGAQEGGLEISEEAAECPTDDGACATAGGWMDLGDLQEVDPQALMG